MYIYIYIYIHTHTHARARARARVCVYSLFNPIYKFYQFDSRKRNYLHFSNYMLSILFYLKILIQYNLLTCFKLFFLFF